ncbi:cytochrome c biogenesis protein [Actinorhabdospora filicis]|uniref:Cytochrome c biogenesis protein n=1 Tax=Actinorhabdospora filicis TaxID=1785913 RepID=A0A9W6W814_9ACTN|nr:cytochrome c biogenesis protein ResB [Actinorhabdospora filicis]GLZ77119.1 cytochrome c biogenesis protein [Actinorhabdospora filicis]
MTVDAPPRPAKGKKSPRAVSLARKWWGQLTSMRTALILLFALAVAAVPGSILPQRSVNVENVGKYFTDHPQAAPIMDRLWLFDVYSAPWFAAIYGLLFVSLVGCLIPRLREHVDAIRRRPPDAPARLSLMPQHDEWESGAGAAKLAGVLKARRFRVETREHADGSVTVSGEKGYLRETGNLIFHFALLGLLVGVAVGALYGWHGNRILGAGADAAFCNNLQQYDDYGLGPNISAADLPKFCVQLDGFKAEYLDNGQPVTYAADVLYGEGGEAPTEKFHLEVNEPLRMGAANLYLLGQGYTPVLTYTDAQGNTQVSRTPFLPMNASMLSEGVATFPDANLSATGQRDRTRQMAFEGMFLPTAPEQAPYTTSLFPDSRNPGVMLFPYVGDLGLDNGKPGSVYALDRRQVATGQLKPMQVGFFLKQGESKTLEDGSTVTFTGLERWITVQARSDPGEPVVLWSAIAVLAGLLPSLTVKRRRVWFRVRGDNVTAGGLARTENPGFATEFGDIVASAKET